MNKVTRIWIGFMLMASLWACTESTDPEPALPADADEEFSVGREGNIL